MTKVVYFCAGTFDPNCEVDLEEEFVYMVNSLFRRDGAASDLLLSSKEDVKAACAMAGTDPEEVWADEKTKFFKVTIQEIPKGTLQ